MTIERHRRKLRNGEERIYTYQVMPNGQRRSLSIRTGSDSDSIICYRSREKKRIAAALLANSSLLVIGEPGSGKSFLAQLITQEVIEQGFLVSAPSSGTAKQTFMAIADDLGIDTETIEGKAMTSQQLQEAIADWLSNNTAFLILDDAHRFPVSIRCWLEKLHEQGQPMLLLATYPPARDIFIKLPRIELEPLPNHAIREIMEDEAVNLGIELKPGQMAELQQRTGGNPMLARRVVREEYLGLDGHALDHTQWIDGTPFLIAALMCFMIMRFLGLGFNNTSLYLLGGIMTVAVGIIRIMIYSLPRQGGRLGQ
ncbi:putative AAA ATPase, possibly membrane bound [Crocosphaera subtropica ATCC 51142]|uniref:AAA ATPase, possibly membrane bound n=1 Tax=Crocosphaera subtropica (strain ATCC 51142 / BH68) TaxID=43989 RepID=B1X2Y7_CROS5|nr:ATP-binding protein [Crocosphaera subtropica]ACB54498.1 putative AAA ATPase, possibly membrane bound [Crocosphaera subtropica ATCC 51142]